MERVVSRAASTFLVLMTVWPDLAGADVVRLKNGNALEGTISAADERQVTIELPDLGAMVVNRAEIAAIEQAAPSGDEGVAAPTGTASPVSDEALEVFVRSERSVRLPYPKGWHVQERADRHPYTVTTSPDPLPPRTGTPTILELRKYYHASRTTGLKAAAGEQLIESYLETFRRQGARITDRHDATVQGVPALEIEARAVGSKSATHLLLVLAVKDNTLAVLYCQSPAGTFDAQRGFFDAAAERFAPFSTDASQSDSAQLDLESKRITEQALIELKSGNVADAMSRLQQALRANPGDLMVRMAYGSLQLDVGLQKSEPQRTAFLQRAEAELQQAVAWLEVEADPADVPALAQAYFMLGEVEARGRNDAVKARTLYEKSLTVYPQHHGAKQALGR